MERFVKKPRLSTVPESQLLEPLCELSQDDPHNGTNSFVDVKRAEPTINSFITPTHLPEVPYQPDDVPPYHDRRRHHLFQKKWYVEYPWLHYDTESRAVYCFQCLSAVIKGTSGLPNNNIFAREGFRNWKKGVERFRVHENSQLHRETCEYSVSRLLDMKADCAVIEMIVSSLRFLIGIGYEVNSSGLIKLLELRRKDLPLLDEHLSKTVFSQDDERKLVEFTSLCALRNLSVRIHNDGLFGVTFETVSTPGSRMMSVTVKTSQMLRGRSYFLGLYPRCDSSLDLLAQHLSFENLFVFVCKSPDLRDLEKTLEKRYPSALNLSCLERKLVLEVQDSLRNIKGSGHYFSLVRLLIQVLSEVDNEFSLSIFDGEVNLSRIDYKTVQSVLKNYARIAQRTRDLRDSPPWEIRSSTIADFFEKPETVFNLLACKTFFYPIETLSDLVEKAESIKGIKEAVVSVLNIVTAYKSEEDFNAFWDKCTATCESLQLRNEGHLDVGKKAYWDTLEAVEGALRRLMSSLKDEKFEDLAALENAVESSDENDEPLKVRNVANCLGINLENLNMEKRMLIKMIDKDAPKLSLMATIRHLRLMEREMTRLFPELTKLANVFVIAQIAKEVEEVTTCRLGSLENFLAITKSNELIHELSLLYVYCDDSSILCNKDIAQAYINNDPSRLEMLFKY